MQELSLNVLDIAQNSIRAGADLIEIEISKHTASGILEIRIKDNGCGMTEEQIAKVIDPFFTTRTTRKIGLGVPFFKMTAEMTGGDFSIQSKVGEGTEVCATYHYRHIDMLPLGDMASTVVTLVSVNPQLDFIYRYRVDTEEFVFDTREIKQTLDGVAINENEILAFLKEMLEANMNEANAGTDEIV